MPLRLPPITDSVSRLLLEGIVDYAGLYPPAAHTMRTAVRQYAHYRAGGTGWMLGRFVCPALSLQEFSEVADPLLPRDAGAIPWRITVTGSGDVAADIAAIAAFNERHRVCFDECGAKADSYELRAASVSDIAEAHALVPPELTTYVELPLDGDLEPLVREVARTGRRAKMRTGGVQVGAFPRAAQLLHFLQLCVTHGVPAKATAGLHHPLRGAYRLTYDDDAPTGRMFGFLNVLLTAALVVQGSSEAEALALLEEGDSHAFEWNDLHVAWRGIENPVALSRDALRQVREQVLVSVGSCSFTEPVEESRALGWI
jgi:hypothetical protein